MFNEQFFSYIMARASCIRLDDENIRFRLDQHAQLDFIVLAHITNSLLVDMFHSSTLFWFRATQSLFLVLIGLCLWKILQIPNAWSLGLPDMGVGPTIYSTLSIIQYVLRLCVFSLIIYPNNQPTYPSRRAAQHSGETRSYFFTRWIPRRYNGSYSFYQQCKYK